MRRNIDFNRLLQDKKPPCGGFFKKLGDENLRRHERKIRSPGETSDSECSEGGRVAAGEAARKVKPTKLLSYILLKTILNSTPYTLTLKKQTGLP